MAAPAADTAVVACPACGQKNRVAIETAARMVRRLPVNVVCGRCRAPLTKGGQ